MFKKLRESWFWKDTVLSKNISQIIAYIFALLWVPLTSWINKIPIWELLNKKIEIYWVIILFSGLLVLSIMISSVRLRKKKISNVELIKEDIQTWNNWVDGPIKWRWNIIIYNGLKISVKNLIPYCNEHSQRLQPDFMGYELKCPFCNVKIPTVPGTNYIEKMRLVILSNIENDVEKLKEKYGVE